MVDLYINAFDKSCGRMIELPLSHIGQCIPNEKCIQCASLVGYLPSTVPITSGTVGTALIPASTTSSTPNSFNVNGGNIGFGYLGIYNVEVAGQIVTTPGTKASVTITPTTTGGARVVGPSSATATAMNGTGAFDYPFLVNVPTCGSTLSFSATTASSNVSIINGSINIIRVCDV